MIDKKLSATYPRKARPGVQRGKPGLEVKMPIAAKGDIRVILRDYFEAIDQIRLINRHQRDRKEEMIAFAMKKCPEALTLNTTKLSNCVDSGNF